MTARREGGREGGGIGEAGKGKEETEKEKGEEEEEEEEEAFKSDLRPISLSLSLRIFSTYP